MGQRANEPMIFTSQLSFAEASAKSSRHSSLLGSRSHHKLSNLSSDFTKIAEEFLNFPRAGPEGGAPTPPSGPAPGKFKSYCAILGKLEFAYN